MTEKEIRRLPPGLVSLFAEIADQVDGGRSNGTRLKKVYQEFLASKDGKDLYTYLCDHMHFDGVMR